MNAKSFISLKEVLDYFNSGKPFSIVYVKADKQKGTSGGVKTIERAIKNYKKEAPNTDQTSDAKTFSSRNPNHFFNSTINLRVNDGGSSQIRTVHVQLIRIFNGAYVK